jgi:hypothetical protein
LVVVVVIGGGGGGDDDDDDDGDFLRKRERERTEADRQAGKASRQGGRQAKLSKGNRGRGDGKVGEREMGDVDKQGRRGEEWRRGMQPFLFFPLLSLLPSSSSSSQISLSRRTFWPYISVFSS